MAKHDYTLVRSVKTHQGELCHFKDREAWLEKPKAAVSVDDLKLFLLNMASRLVHDPTKLVKISNRIPIRVSSRSQQKLKAGVELFTGNTDQSYLRQIVQEHEQAKSRQQLSYMLSVNDTWRPKFEIEDRGALDQAVSNRRGVILWVENFLPHVLVGKRALHENGIAASHLSVPMHGFPETKFGARVHHRKQVSIENKFIDQRIVFDPSKDSARGRLEDLLKDGKIIFITNNVFAGRRIIDMPLNENLRFDIAAGPINLAMKTGSALLPIATIEAKPLELYTTHIGHDIVGGELQHSDDQVTNAVINYRNWLVPLLRSRPEQWVHWQRVRSG